MADSKISALPAATTPLGGTEVLPIVQSGVTDKVTVANLTAGRAVSALSFSSTTGSNFATASGNLGIGTTSPGAKLDVNGQIYCRDTNGIATDRVSPYAGLSLSLVAGSQPMLFTVNSAERMRLDISGNLLVGKTSASGAAAGIELAPAGLLVATRSADIAGYFNRLTSDGNLISMNRSNVLVGSISVTTAATAYNTSSDYRLKNITGPITTSGAYIDSLKPVEGTWKADGSTFVGLIAHETQEVSRTTVATGTKDGDEMQGMDYSSAEIIANLIAELQDLRKRVSALEPNGFVQSFLP